MKISKKTVSMLSTREKLKDHMMVTELPTFTLIIDSSMQQSSTLTKKLMLSHFVPHV